MTVLLSPSGSSILPLHDFPGSAESAGAPIPIDDRPGVLRAADILAALGLPAEQDNSGGYPDWPHPTHGEMVCCLAR